MSTFHPFPLRKRDRGKILRPFPRLAFAVLTLGFVIPEAEAAVIYQEDFSSISAGWSIGTKTSGTTTIGEVAFAQGDSSSTAFATRSLLLSHVSGNTTRIASTMPGASYSIPVSPVPSDLTYTFQFDLRLSRTDMSGYIVFYDATQASQNPMLIQITADGRFLTGYWNGTANRNDFVLLNGYEADTTYTFTFTTTPSTGRYSLSVTGGTNDLIDQLYRRTVSGGSIFAGFNTMAIYNDGGAMSGIAYDLYVDNILIQSIPEPGSVALLLSASLGGILYARRRGV